VKVDPRYFRPTGQCAARRSFESAHQARLEAQGDIRRFGYRNGFRRPAGFAYRWITSPSSCRKDCWSTRTIKPNALPVTLRRKTCSFESPRTVASAAPAC
jgi:hypothetical protein